MDLRKASAPGTRRKTRNWLEDSLREIRTSLEVFRFFFVNLTSKQVESGGSIEFYRLWSAMTSRISLASDAGPAGSTSAFWRARAFNLSNRSERQMFSLGNCSLRSGCGWETVCDTLDGSCRQLHSDCSSWCSSVIHLRRSQRKCKNVQDVRQSPRCITRGE